MSRLTLGNTLFDVLPIKPSRSFQLQARIYPIVVEIAGIFARIIEASKTKTSTDEKPDVVAEIDENGVSRPFAAIAKVFEEDIEKILPIVSGAFSQLHPEELQIIQRELLSETCADGNRLYANQPGKPDFFDTVMVARTLDTWRLMWEALKVTYPDFLAPLLARAARAGAPAPSAA